MLSCIIPLAVLLVLQWLVYPSAGSEHCLMCLGVSQLLPALYYSLMHCKEHIKYTQYFHKFWVYLCRYLQCLVAKNSNFEIVEIHCENL